MNGSSISRRSMSGMRPIGVVHSEFTTAAGTPIQPAYAAGARGTVEVDSPFVAALADLEGFEWVWLVYWMHTAGSFESRVVPYRDTQDHGLFATRAPNRPNPIGLSAVRLLGRRGNVLDIGELDILDGTPLLDIKPYVPEFDSHPQAKAGWFDTAGHDQRLADDRFHGGSRLNPRPELVARKAAFVARTERYLRLGYDRLAAANFIVESAGPLAGPALDVGTGRGLTAMALARLGLDVVSVDPDAAEQALAALLAEEAGLGGQIHFLPSDAAALAYPQGHFGCVALVDVLHHLEGPRPVLEAVAQLVRKGGKILLADFDRAGFALLARVHREEGGEHPESGFTLEAAVAWLAAAGFHACSRAEQHLHEIAVLIRER